MPRQIEEIPLVAFNIDHASKAPIYKQIYEAVSNSISSGKFVPGQKLPGTRNLAKALNISRFTVTTAFQQLLYEGYIFCRQGAGTFIKNNPDKLLFPMNLNNRSGKEKKSVVQIYKQIKPLLGYRETIAPKEIIPFQTSVPSFENFPFKTWLQLNNKASRIYSNIHLRYGDAVGYQPLREEIAKYLRTYRAVNCTAGQVIIVNGSQQGLNLIVRSLVRKSDSVVIEDPGYFGIKMALKFTQAKICPVPLDQDGLDIDYLSENFPGPKLIYTTPSHQYPLGSTMGIIRRNKLLQFAAKSNSLIIEDDYDSELRYSGSPLPSLQGLDRHNSVIYLGTFSKILFPGLRLGYLVVTDPALFEILAAVKLMTDIQSPVFEQIITYFFLKDGHFTKHIRKSRVLYHARQEILVNEIKRELNGLLKVNESPAGMHLNGWLPPKTNDKQIAEICRQKGVTVVPLSNSSVKFFKDPALMLGYTSFNEAGIRLGIKRLKQILLEHFR